jgi:hypothetical protein
MKDSFENIGTGIKDIGSGIKKLDPLDSVGIKLVMGILEGAVNPRSQENIDTLTERLTKVITTYLNKRLETINTAVLSKNLIDGAVNRLGAKTTSDTLGMLIDSLGMDLNKNVNLLIRNAISEIQSEDTKRVLGSIVANILNDDNRKLLDGILASMVKNAQGGLDSLNFKNIGINFRAEVLNDSTRMSVNNVISPIKGVTEDLLKVVKNIEEQNKVWWKEHFWKLIASIAGLLLLCGWLWRRNIKKSKEGKLEILAKEAQIKNLYESKHINDIIISVIDEYNKDGKLNELTRRIQQRTIDGGLQEVLASRISQLRLDKDNHWKSSQPSY